MIFQYPQNILDYFNIHKDIEEYQIEYGLEGVIESIDYDPFSSQIVVKLNKLFEEYSSVKEKLRGLEVIEDRVDLLIFWDNQIAENLLMLYNTRYDFRNFEVMLTTQK